MIAELEGGQKLKFLSLEEQEAALAGTKNKKYRLAMLLMLDCGLRRGEVINIQLSHLDFQKSMLHVKSLKKRTTREAWRSVPIPSRTLDALAQYVYDLKDRNPETFLFPAGRGSKSGKGGMNPRQIEKKVRKITRGGFSPHSFRHSYATRLVNEGVALLTVSRLLGHAQVSTTEIYAHVPEIQLREAVHRIDKRTWLQRIYRHYFPPPQVHVLPTKRGDKTNFIIGRRNELARLAELSAKKVNILMLGPQGVGKSHLLDNYEGSKILRVDDMTRGKKVLAGLVLELFDQDKEAVVGAVYTNQDKNGNPLLDRDGLGQIVMKDSEKRLLEVLTTITQPLEYTIIIDQADHITPTAVRILERLKNHFHMIVAARAVRVSQATWLTNFQRIELKPLGRPESMELIEKMSRDFQPRIRDFQAYQNHIFDQTGGIPLFIIEMCERYSKEDKIDFEVVRQINHTAATPDIDMTIPFILVLSSLMILRYVGRELGDEDTGAYKLIGGAALLFLIFGRPIFAQTKRRYI